jgi:endonuclease YncB( thermonuclease family)
VSDRIFKNQIAHHRQNFHMLSMLLFIIVFSSCSPSDSRTLVGTVVKVADGDTITVLDDEKVEHRVRLMGIDAPEQKQAYSQVSRQNLASLAFGKRISVEYRKLDRYGRIVVCFIRK